MIVLNEDSIMKYNIPLHISDTKVALPIFHFLLAYKVPFNPVTTGAIYIHFLLAYYISAFKLVKDKTWH